MTVTMNEQSSKRTPYDDSYPTCERTCVELRIYPGSMNPDCITQRLKINPSLILRKGERKINSLGRERIVKLNGWFLSTEGRVFSLDLRRHLDWLLDKIEPRAAELRDLQHLANVQMSLDCIWWSAHGQGGPTLWPEHMRRIAALDLECGFDIAFFGDE